MIQTLKRRYVWLGALSLFLLLSLLVVGMNALNYSHLAQTADEILLLLCEREEGPHDDRELHGLGLPAPGGLPKPADSPELFYESRYFTVLFDADGRVERVLTERIASVDEERAVFYAREVLAAERSQGFFLQFRFLVLQDGGQLCITFLDRTRELSQAQSFLVTSVLLASGAFLLVFSLLFFVARRLVRPIEENYEKQRRFITDASHELRTPLAVIRTNADLLELELSDGEPVAEIRRQCARLSDLSEDLILLSRAEEKRGDRYVDFPLSEVVQAAAHPFDALCRTQGKRLAVRVEPLLTLRGDARGIERLVTLLLDNALKYSSADAEILLSLGKNGKRALLSVQNPTDVRFSDEELSHLFERFWRPDSSRNSSTGGYGIGLSACRAIVSSHGGRITAQQQENGLFSVTCLL